MKKTTANNRRKKLPLLLGALLIISVAAYGTRAYFSDSAKQQANIALELGDVDIIMDDTSKWAYTPLTDVNDTSNIVNTSLLDANETPISETAEIGDASEITNVRPGDAFTREFVVTNNGTLDAKLSLVEGDIQSSNVEGTPFIIEVKEPETTLIKPEDEANYTVIITVDPDANDDYNTGNSKYDITPLDTVTLNYFTKYLNVEAIQTNGELE